MVQIHSPRPFFSVQTRTFCLKNRKGMRPACSRQAPISSVLYSPVNSNKWYPCRMNWTDQRVGELPVGHSPVSAILVWRQKGATAAVRLLEERNGRGREAAYRAEVTAVPAAANTFSMSAWAKGRKD